MEAINTVMHVAFWCGGVVVAGVVGLFVVSAFCEGR